MTGNCACRRFTRLGLLSIALLSHPLHAAQDTGSIPAGPTPPEIDALLRNAAPPQEAAAAGNPATATEEDKPRGSSEVHISSYGSVDLIVQNDDIHNVLAKLGAYLAAFDRNIVASHNVDVIVKSATIRGEPLDVALDLLLRPNGLGFVEDDGNIIVYTLDEMSSMDVVKKRLVSRIIRLDYLKAEDARRFTQHLMSPEGEITFTKDLETQAQSEVNADSAGSSVGAGTEIYTPTIDEYSLSNSVVVHDLPDNVDRIEQFLREMDVRPTQVLIECTIIQTSVTEENAFGVDFALLSDVQFTDFFQFPDKFNPIDFSSDSGGGGTPALAPDNRGFAVSNPGNTGAGDGTLKIGITSSDVGVFIRALDRVTDVTLMSNPKLMVLNRQRSKVLVGKRVSYLLTTVVENQVLESLEFIDTGIVLDIRPYVLRDGRIRLELSPKVSEVDLSRTTTNSSGGTMQLPDEIIRTITTDVLVPEGQTAVLGGLFREDTTKMRSQVPILGDIPLLGRAFRGDDDVLGQEEIIFLIRPTIMSDDVLADLGAKGEEHAEAVRVGSRQGLLPWSRERRTSSLNLKAADALRQGDREKALYYVRRSLALHPLQPEMVQMHQRIVQDPKWWPTRSQLERIVREGLGLTTPAAEEGD